MTLFETIIELWQNIINLNYDVVTTGRFQTASFEKRILVKVNFG